MDGLPEWDDWGKLLRDGFFVTVAEIVYTLPFILLIIVGAAATGGLTSVTGSENAAGLIATTGGLGILCLVFLFVIALLLLMPAILIQYAIKDDFGALFRFNEVFGLMRANMADILMVFLGFGGRRYCRFAGDRCPSVGPVPGLDRRLRHWPGRHPVHLVRDRPSVWSDRGQGAGQQGRRLADGRRLRGNIHR